MARFKDITAGQSAAPVFSAARHNAVNRLLEDDTTGEQGNGDPRFSRSFSCLTIKNTTAVDAPRGGVMALDGPVISADNNADLVKNETYRVRGIAPVEADHSDRFAILIKPVPAGEVVRKAAVTNGWVAANVNVTNVSHRFAKIVDNDITRLESSEDTGAPMNLAQAGTGLKTAMVFLGGTAEKGDEGQPGSVGAPGSGVDTFELLEDKTADMVRTQARLINPDGTPITVQATKFNVADEDAMLLVTEGGAANEVAVGEYVRRLDLNRAFRYDGPDPTLVSSWPDAGPARAEIMVIDKTRHVDPTRTVGGFVASAAYTDANGQAQEASRGECKFVESREITTGSGTTGDPSVTDYWSFCEIVWIEGEADELEVQFIAEPPIVPDLTGEPDGEVEIPVNVVRVLGANGQNRMPKQFELRDASQGFAIFDSAWYTSGELAGNVITVKREPLSGKYYPTRPSTLRGLCRSTTEVTAATQVGNVLTLGTGTADAYVERATPEENVVEIATLGFKVWNQAGEAVEAGKNASFEVINGRRMIYVEPCKQPSAP